MNNLKRKSEEQFSTSWLHQPICENTVPFSNHLYRLQDRATAYGEALTSAPFEQGDPIPSMFRVKECLSASENPASGVLSASLFTGVTPYIAATLLCMLISGAAVHVSTAKPSQDGAAAELPPAPRIGTPKVEDGPALEIAKEAPIAALEPKAASAELPPSNGEPWSQTVRDL